MDLPPNWQTVDMSAPLGGVADNLPPLPPSLGSISGRRTEPSGYTPQDGGGRLSGARGRASSLGSSRGSGHIRRINDRSNMSQERGSQSTGRSSHTRRIRERNFRQTGQYVNVDTASQNLGDRMEGPAMQPGAEGLNGAWMDIGPPIPARNLTVATAPRPEQPHPGRMPPRDFFELGARAYTAYGDYEVRRMVANGHLGLPAPMVNILPTVTPETRDRTMLDSGWS